MAESYISVEKALQAIDNAKPDRIKNPYGDGAWGESYFHDYTVKSIVRHVPVEDVVPVIRCRDCAYFIPSNFGKLQQFDCGNLGCKMEWPSPDAYCSYAVRRIE